MPEGFASKGPPDQEESARREQDLYRTIDQLDIELDWLKKNLPSCTAKKQAMIEPDHRKLSVARPCRLLGLPRSSYYPRSQPLDAPTQALMVRIDKLYLERSTLARGVSHGSCTGRAWRWDAPLPDRR